MVRQGQLIALVGTCLIGCAVFLMAGASGVQAETSKKEQGSSPQATSEEEARCQRTQTIDLLAKSPSSSPAPVGLFVTNDLPGCPNKGGLLSDTDERTSSTEGTARMKYTALALEISSPEVKAATSFTAGRRRARCWRLGPTRILPGP